MATPPLTLSDSMRDRLWHWESVTGLDAEHIGPRAMDAYTGFEAYTTDKEIRVGLYKSSHAAGLAHADALPTGVRSDDRRLEDWGNFLIDLGSVLLPQRRYDAACQRSAALLKKHSPAHWLCRAAGEEVVASRRALLNLLHNHRGQ